MKLVRLRISNFRSFPKDFTEIDLENTTFLLGPNGSGKTAILQALARMFSLDPLQRKVVPSDFHIEHGSDPDEQEERELWVEADFEFPALEGEEAADPAIPGNFAHMQLAAAEGPATVRFRLRATMDEDGEITEQFTYVLDADADGTPTQESKVSKQERASIQVHYLPARRDPATQISYSANALLGRVLRAADWTAERDAVADLTQQISQALEENGAIEGITSALGGTWKALHKGTYFKDPAISFARSELENLLRHLSVDFSPGHGASIVDFSRLSDGQQSLLYLSIVLGVHEIGAKALAGKLNDAFDIDKLRPAVFTLIAVEEPENSLSPHYLGRVVKSLGSFGKRPDAQAILATHSPSLMRRIEPGHVRYLRLDEKRESVVKSIKLPPKRTEANKFVREAVKAFPELYFSRLVILGEGDSEEVVLPRLLAATGILADDASISVVPLGGRHVNHFWRLLSGLGIPYVTLLDLDVARHGGGWGRIKYAASQYVEFAGIDDGMVDGHAVTAIPAWNAEANLVQDDKGWIARLETHNVYFSAPIDLDFLMMMKFPKAYEVDDDELEAPDDAAKKAVLGKSPGKTDGRFTTKELSYFDAYNSRFKVGSKPSWHIQAMANLDSKQLRDAMPAALKRLLGRVAELLKDLPE